MGKILHLTFLVVIFLSGCVTIDPARNLHSALGETYQLKLDEGIKIKQENEEKEKIRNGVCLADSFELADFLELESGTFKKLNTDVINNIRNKFSKLNSITTLKPNENASDLIKASSFTIGHEDAIGFFRGGLLSAIHQASSDFFNVSRIEKDLSLAEKDFSEFSKMFQYYLYTYIDGEFVLKDGTKLAKPSGNITHDKVGSSDNVADAKNKSTISASLDNGTVAGLATVLLEALYDHCDATKIIAIKEGKIVYTPDYVEDKDKSSGNYLMVYKKNPSDDYLFGDENNKPTSLIYRMEELKNNDALYYICEEENRDKCVNKDIFKEDILAIRKFTKTAAEMNKSIAGSAIKSIGGLGLSFGGFFKLSVGDNDSVKQIVETTATTTTKRVTESLMVKALIAERKNCNEKKQGECGPVDILVKKIRNVKI